MNILHVVHAYPPSVGGSQHLTAELSCRLVADYGDQVSVFTTNALSTEHFWRGGSPLLPVGSESMDGVLVRRFGVDTRWLFWRRTAASLAYRLNLPGNDRLRTRYQGPVVPGLKEAIARSDADVIFATAFPLNHMYDVVAGAERSGIPVVLLGALHPLDRWGFDRPMILDAIRRCCAYIAHTEYEKAYLVERGIDVRKIVIIGAGVDVEALDRGSAQRIRARYKWGDDLLVGTLGKQQRRKRLDVILDGMERLWPSRPDVRLVLAGARGGESERIAARVDRLPPEWRARVHLLLDLSEEEKADLLASLDIFVQAAAEESFGMAMVEAWAAGCAVVGVDEGAIGSLIRPDVDSLRVPYGDGVALSAALTRLVEDGVRRRRLGEAGRARVAQDYTWSHVTARVRDVYRRLIGEG